MPSKKEKRLRRKLKRLRQQIRPISDLSEEVEEKEPETTMSDHLVEAGISAAIGYLFYYMIGNNGTVKLFTGQEISKPMLGALSTGASSLLVDFLEENYFKDIETYNEFDKNMMGMLGPILSGGSNSLILYLLTGKPNNMQGLAKSFVIGAAASGIADYVNDVLLDDLF